MKKLTLSLARTALTRCLATFLLVASSQTAEASIRLGGGRAGSPRGGLAIPAGPQESLETLLMVVLMLLGAAVAGYVALLWVRAKARGSAMVRTVRSTSGL